MRHDKAEIAHLLTHLDLGSSVAEEDTLLERARVETSAFSELWLDKVDLIPGTRGSGKSALYRIFVDYLADSLLDHRKVVIAHGVQRHGDPVFQAYKTQFEQLDEEDFVAFWCIYLISLAHEHFVKDERYRDYLAECSDEVARFRELCSRARIPEIDALRTLKQILAWGLAVLATWRPKVTWKLPAEAGEIGLDLFGQPLENQDLQEIDTYLPTYVTPIKEGLQEILRKSNLSLWLMIDKLDEIFERRSDVERRGLRGLLRVMRVLNCPEIRLKIFLRDDILEQIVAGGEGFTALTHITARQADKLTWSEDQIVAMVVKRIFGNEPLREYLRVDQDRLNASPKYQREAFYQVFPDKVYRGANQSPTHRWIYNHTADGKGVVTPRDVIDLLTAAKRWQQDECTADASGTTEWIISPAAIRHGLAWLSTRKRTTLLSEFPHLWAHIEKFVGGKTEYSESAIKRLLGKHWKATCEDLAAVGIMSRFAGGNGCSYKFPFVDRAGLELTQGRVD
ncbi:MAG: hypothetical protein V3T84_12565 [Phycisphaerales bacterium]